MEIESGARRVGLRQIVEVVVILATAFGANIALARVVDVTLDAVFR